MPGCTIGIRSAWISNWSGVDTFSIQETICNYEFLLTEKFIQEKAMLEVFVRSLELA